MMFGYACWVTVCTFLGAWFGHAGWDSSMFGGVVGYTFGICSSVLYYTGFGKAAADIAETALTTFGDVLDDD